MLVLKSMKGEQQIFCGFFSVSSQASYWSSKKYQVHGGVYSPSGEKVRNLFGTWHEAMFCGSPSDNPTCVWAAGKTNREHILSNKIHAGEEKAPHSEQNRKCVDLVFQNSFIASSHTYSFRHHLRFCEVSKCGLLVHVCVCVCKSN